MSCPLQSRSGCHRAVRCCCSTSRGSVARWCHLARCWRGGAGNIGHVDGTYCPAAVSHQATHFRIRCSDAAATIQALPTFSSIARWGTNVAIHRTMPCPKRRRGWRSRRGGAGNIGHIDGTYCRTVDSHQAAHYRTRCSDAADTTQALPKFSSIVRWGTNVAIHRTMPCPKRRRGWRSRCDNDE